MPHKNPKVDKAEKNVQKAITDKKGNHGNHAALNRSVVKAGILQEIAEVALADDKSALLEACDHTEKNVDTILDLIEEAS